jgi:hypothetical protein
LGANNIKEIPTSVIQLTNLRELWFNSNNQTEIPTSIRQLTKLETLILSYNKITKIPTSIIQLSNLQKLWLDHNKITHLPTWLCELRNLKDLLVDGNPITFPPGDILNKGTGAILEYLREYSLGTEEWKAIKVITIGDAGNGKVNLSFKLTNNKNRQQQLMH